jgi:hypothetical protein
LTRRTTAIGAACLALITGVADARLTHFIVETRERVPAARPGAPDYEILRGHYDGVIDPRDPHNAIITDLKFAPRDRDGRVPYSATFAIARPLDRASGALFYDVPNRGNGTVAADSDGHIRAISGWQSDLPKDANLQTATVPVAHGPHGPLTGPVLQRFVDIKAGAKSIAITGSIGRPTPRPLPVSLDTRKARLFTQASDSDPPHAIAPGDWAFADCSEKPFPGTPDPARLCVRGGFDPKLAYTLIYEGRDPLVQGIGFAAVRDFAAFLRYAAADDAGTPNPVAGQVRWPIITGTSQSGNFVKSFINLGFNAAENGRRVFDGANPNIAARQVPLNIRFGVPGGAATLFEPGSEGTLWWTRYDDRVRGRGVSSLLDRCRASHTCPKIMETFGSAEFWGLRMSPGLVGTDAHADLPLPAEVRRYYFPGVTHGGSYVGAFSLTGDPAYPGAPRCALPANPNPSFYTMRALMVRLLAWVAEGRAPPPSHYPRLASGQLVAPNAKAMGWPAIPGAPSPDGKLNAFLDYDFGAGFDYHGVSGVLTRQPPIIRRTIKSLVPRVDGDGNEVSGVPSVQFLVPIGTYTGWNQLQQGYGAGGACGFMGGFIPFAKTKADRLAAHDPRPSLEERYQHHQGFVARVRAVAQAQVREGWLLPEDAERIERQAEASDVLR